MERSNRPATGEWIDRKHSKSGPPESKPPQTHRTGEAAGIIRDFAPKPALLE
jgi:hypothetical protein